MGKNYLLFFANNLFKSNKNLSCLYSKYVMFSQQKLSIDVTMSSVYISLNIFSKEHLENLHNFFLLPFITTINREN